MEVLLDPQSTLNAVSCEQQRHRGNTYCVEQQATNKVIFIIGHLVLVGLVESRDHKFMSSFKQVFNKLQTKFMTFFCSQLVKRPGRKPDL